MFVQVSAFFGNFKSKFAKGYGTQHCFLTMLEKWKQCVDKGKVFGALLTDLSKSFDSLDHELLTAKVKSYSFNLPGLLLVNDYL